MNRLILIVLSSFFLSIPLFAQKTITIFHINDTHSYIFPWGPKINGISQNGGASRLIKRYRDLRSTAVNPILLHGGDSFTGGMVFNRFLGRAEFQLFDSMGVAAFVLGNHEFDLKPARLKDAIAQSGARFDFLSANIQYNNDQSGLQQYVKPFVVKQVGNVRVGIFGLTTTSTVFYGESTPVTFETAAPVARRMVDSLKTKNVDLIVALSHLGLSEDRELAKNVNGIHLIVGGHSHTPLKVPVLERTPAGDSTIIIQAGSKWEYLGMLALTMDNNKLSWTYRLDRIDAQLPEDPQILPTIQGFRDSIIAMYGDVFSNSIAVLEEDFPSLELIPGNLELPLMGLVTDAYRYATKADFTFEVASLMRQNLYKGPISTSDLRNMLSWSYDSKQGLGKRLTVLVLKGSTIPLLLTATVALNFDAFAGLYGTSLALHPSGIRYTIRQEGGSTTFENIWVRENPLDENRVYSLVVNEFVADLTKRYPFLQFESRTDLPLGAVEAVQEYLGVLKNVRLDHIPLGRVWNHTSITPLTLSVESNGISLSWPQSSSAVSYNLHQKRIGNVNEFVKINATPIRGTTYLDESALKNRQYAYMLEEVRSNGLRFFNPPVRTEGAELPFTSFISGNYPNPFNSSTTIEYTITESGEVDLSIYNTIGQLISSFRFDHLEAGEYVVRWNGKNDKNEFVSSGIYVGYLRTTNHASAHKLVLIR